MKASDLRSKIDAELHAELEGLRKEQFNLRMQRGAGQLANPMRFGAVRKDIARIKTVLNERKHAQALTQSLAQDAAKDDIQDDTSA